MFAMAVSEVALETFQMVTSQFHWLKLPQKKKHHHNILKHFFLLFAKW